MKQKFSGFACLVGIAMVLVSCGSHKPSETRTDVKPNVIFILADDMGYGDIRALNPEGKIETPHLDRLASEGMSFSDAHTNSAVCTPTRYGILTGRYCYRSRLKSSVLYGYSESLVEPGRTTLASLLKDQAYQTACIGKWHLGLGWQKKDPAKPLFVKRDNWEIDLITNCDYEKAVSSGPNSIGFDYSYILPGSLDMAPYVYVEDHRVKEAVSGVLEAVDTERGVFYRQGEMAEGFDIHQTLDHFTDRAVDYITEASSTEQAFFLYFPLTAPHTPWLPSEQFRGKSGAGVYGDFVMHVDFVVGRILTSLDQLGISDNTIVVFTSDNGSHWTPEDIEKWSHRANHHYAGMKSDIWDGGHRVPFLVRWPGKVKAGARSGQLICTTDWLATSADIAGYPLSDEEGEDSYSFLPELLGISSESETGRAVIHHSLPGEFAIRQGKWKYLDCRGSGGWSSGGEESDPAGQLYNMESDPGEQHNLYASMPEKVEQLKSLLEEYKLQNSITIEKRRNVKE